MKVYLKYPWSIPDSNYYKSMIKNPPKDVEYINMKPEDFQKINQAKQFKTIFKLKKFVRKCLTMINQPNIVETNEKADVVHCAHCLLKNKVPWVVDTESYWNLSATSNISYSIEGIKKIKKLLKSEYCKKILPWTETARKEISIAMRDEEIDKKMEVVPYAVPLPEIKKIPHDKLTFLFIGRYFREKGGYTALRVLNALLKEYDIHVIIVSPVPDDVKHLDLFKDEEVEVYDLMEQEKLMKEIYPRADVFLYPGYSDSFGFMMVEAMSYGIPVITVDGYARRDIIDEGITGFIAKRKVVQFQGVPNFDEEQSIFINLYWLCTFLITHPHVIKEMSANCIEEVRNGKFSLDKRNKKLKEIYEYGRTN